MRQNFANGSLILFGLSVLLLLVLTLSESALVGMPPRTEKIFTFALLVLPSGIGALLGVISLARREGRTWLAIVGITLNLLFAAFHVLLLLFAG